MSSMHLRVEDTLALDLVCQTAEGSSSKPKENELRMMVVTHTSPRKKFCMFDLEK